MPYDCPHFRRSPEINVFVKVLLSRVHRGYLWMDLRISLYPHLVVRITRLSKQGIDSSTVNVGKTEDKQLPDTLKTKFNLRKMGRGFDIESINEDATTFATQLLASNIMRKGRHNQVAMHFIELGSQCAQGT